jgi:HTH-type transcriptional regulator / antitoxin HigA
MTETKPVIARPIEAVFWMSPLHGRRKLKTGRKCFITAQSGREVPEEEDEANSFAATWLISQWFDAKLRQLRTDADIRQFADELGIAPGIVVGRLQKEGLIDWKRANSFKRWFKFIEARS